MGFEPTTVGLEVRRSIQTELRALTDRSTNRIQSRLGSARSQIGLYFNGWGIDTPDEQHM